MALLPYDNTGVYRFDGWASPEHTVPRAEAAEILAAVHNHQRLFVDGSRRCGKTTLVINTLEGANIPVLRIDLDGVATKEKLIERIARDARGFLEDHPEARKKLLGSQKVKAGAGTNLFGMLSLNIEAEQSQASQGIERSLDSLLSAIVEVAKAARAVIVVDEFQAVKSPKIKDPEEVLGSFAAVSDPAHTRGEVTFIFAGSNRHQMHQIFAGADSSFFQRTQCIGIGPIPEEDIIPFLDARMGAKVDKAVGKEAFRWTEGIPGDLQRLYSATRRHIADREVVTIEDLEAAKAAVIEDIGRSYTLTLQTLPENNLKMLDAIVSNNVRSREELRKVIAATKIDPQEAFDIVQSLLRLGLLHMTGKSGNLQRPEPILFHYLEKYPAIGHHPFMALTGFAQKPMSKKLEKKLAKKSRTSPAPRSMM